MQATWLRQGAHPCDAQGVAAHGLQENASVNTRKTPGRGDATCQAWDVQA